MGKSILDDLIFDLIFNETQKRARQKHGDEVANLLILGKENIDKNMAFDELYRTYFVKFPKASDKEAIQRYLNAYKKMADLLDQLISQTKQIVYEYELIALEEGNEDDNKD